MIWGSVTYWCCKCVALGNPVDKMQSSPSVMRTQDRFRASLPHHSISLQVTGRHKSQQDPWSGNTSSSSSAVTRIRGATRTRDTRRQLQPWRMMSGRTTGWELNPSWRWWQILYYYYLDRTVVPIKIMVNDTGSVHTVVHCKIKRTLTERYDYCCPALYLLIANVLPMLWWPCARVLYLHCTVEIAKGIRKSGNNCRLS